jgi:pyruvate/2-oxoglutarate dehydrogenase complex dihydrolipoamide dehydrogenase (E3) component
VPVVDGLDVDRAGVERTAEGGVRVDERLRTANPRIFAAGDVCLPFQFTHAADASARIALQNALFAGRRRVSALTIPRATYTDPELAQVGPTEDEARARGLAISVLRRDFTEVDRARTDGETAGFVKVALAAGSDHIIGATIAGPHAGDLISEVSVAKAARVGLGQLAAIVHPYPTYGEALRQLGDAYNRTRLTPGVRRVLRWWFA